MWWGGGGKHCHVEWHCSHLFSPCEEQEEIRSSAHLQQHKCLWQPSAMTAISFARFERGKKKKKKDAPWRICESRRRTAAAPRWSPRRWCPPPPSPGGGTSRSELTMERVEFFFEPKWLQGRTQWIYLYVGKKNLKHFFVIWNKHWREKWDSNLPEWHISHSGVSIKIIFDFLTFFYLQSQLQFQG